MEVTSRMRGGGKHKDKKSKAEKQAASAKTPEQKCDGESKSDEGPEMIPMDEARKWFEEHEEYLIQINEGYQQMHRVRVRRK